MLWVLLTSCASEPPALSEAHFSAVSGSADGVPLELVARFERHLGPGFKTLSVKGPDGVSPYIATGGGKVCVGVIHDQVATSCNDIHAPESTFALIAIEGPEALPILVVAVPDGYAAATLGALQCPVERNAVVIVHADLSEQLVLTGRGMNPWEFPGQVQIEPPTEPARCHGGP